MQTRWIQAKSIATASLLPAVMVLIAAIAPSQTRSQNRPTREELVRPELLRMGKRGEAIAKARESVLEILQAENGCSQWFEEADTEAAQIFASAHYEIDKKGALYISSRSDESGDKKLKHPWGASTVQNGGRDSVIRLNANGPFFSERTQVMYVNAAGGFQGPGGLHHLVVGSYSGNTAEARIVTLLHELGHIVGRLPDDNDSWDGRSSRNTLEILGHCKPEIRAAARRK